MPLSCDNREVAAPTPSLGVSYIMPVLNEEDYLEAAVRSVLEQQYEGEQELILALGPSTDRTTEIAEQLAERDSRIRLVHNPDAHIPNGLNAAIAAARFDVIIRVDAHSELSEGYTATGVASLIAHDAANVGGVMLARGKSQLQSAIARVYNSRFGLGGGAYHRAGEPGEAESAYLGIFRRGPLIEVGMFDPGIRRGEDWELNLRLRQAGYRVWFEPALQVTYWPRARWRTLAQQMFATGSWRAMLVRKYATANPWRFFVPGLLVLATALTILLALLQLTGVFTGPLSARLSVVYLAPLSYVLLTLVVSFRMPGNLTLSDRLLNIGVFATVHYAWGLGFLRGFFFGSRKTVDRSRL